MVIELLYFEDNSLLQIYNSNSTKEMVEARNYYLERRGYIYTIDGDVDITIDGSELYERLIDLANGKEAVISNSKSKRTEDFDEWWASYPSTGTWVSHDGRRFESSRSLRSGSKEDNRRLYTAILNEGKYNHQDMMRVLLYEIEAKKKQSLITGNNNLNYMQGSITYLRQRTFENFMEISKQDSSSVVDTNDNVF